MIFAILGALDMRQIKSDILIERQEAAVYARVSSKEQEKEGFSIPAQLRLLHDYAGQNRLSVAKEFVDIETAKQSGRTGFTEMLAFLKENTAIKTILVEKTDRLYRNIKDWVTLDELGLEIHFAKEGVILSEVPFFGKIHARYQSSHGEELYRQSFRRSAKVWQKKPSRGYGPPRHL
ncbi:MAG: recombinase family protein [Alphaproteobacteria bacterium]|nr:recombinase family protein [Alphaproteobacteria bacterium]